MITPKPLGVLCNRSKHCDFVETTASVCHKNICQAIAEGLDLAQSLPEFGVNDYSAARSLRVPVMMMGIPVARACLRASAVFSMELAQYWQLLNKFP